MLKFEQPKSLSPEDFETFTGFIGMFLIGSHEDMTVKDVINHITSCDPQKSGVWFIHENDVVKGYLFAEVTQNHEGVFTVIHQLYIKGVQDRTIFDKVVEFLKDFGKQFGSREIIFSTDHDPKAFIRLIKNGFKVESHILSLTY